MNSESFIESVNEAKSNSSLKIVIDGLALCHFDKETRQWKVFFPKAPQHDFKVIVEKTTTGKTGKKTVKKEPPYPVKSFTKIEVITDNMQGGGNREMDSMKDVIDLSVLHGEKLKLKTEKKKYAAFLTLNQTNLMLEKDSNAGKMEVWKVEPYPNPVENLIRRDQLAGVIVSEHKFQPGTTTEIRIGNQKPIRLLHDEDTTHVVTFDNDCHQGTKCDPYDFRYYYEIIDESKLSKKLRIDVIPSTDKMAPYGSCLGGEASELAEIPF